MNSLKEGLFRRLVRTHAEGELAKRFLFESMLDEAEGVGTEFENAEAAAKVAYETAQADLDAWQKNKERKGAYDAAFSKLRSDGYSLEKARSELLKDPRYAYNTVLLAKKRETLESALDKAEARYASYNPEVRGYRRTKKGGAKGLASKQMPKPTRRSVLDITKISFMSWHKWPAQIKRTKLSYGTKTAGDDVEQASLGTGPGEEWIAYIFGGQVQGTGVPFDIVMPDGSAWEIKQVLSGKDLIRPATEGIQAFKKAKDHLDNIVKQIRNFTIVAEKIGLADRLSPDDAKRLDFVKSFIDDEAEMIIGKGEVSKERFIDLRSVLITLNKIKTTNMPASSEGAAEMVIGLNDKKVNVDKPTFIDIAKRVEKATKREDILDQFEEVEIALATLKDAAFDDPKAFFNEWFQSIKMSSVFSQVDGVIIVNPQGFMIVPKDQLQTTLKFEKVSQHRPRFAVANFGSGA